LTPLKINNNFLSKIGIGSYRNFGEKLDIRKSQEIIFGFIDQGVNLIDSSVNYADGECEKIIGDILKKNKLRKNLFIASKIFFSTHNNIEDGLSRKNIEFSLDKIKKNYKTDFIDCVQCHRYDPKVNLHELVETFEEQIKISIQSDKPLFLHQRDAHKDFIKVIEPYKNDIKKAVVHCFTGTQEELDDYLELGFHIGLTGWICDERRNVDLRKSLKNIPLDKLMIETDCPYLIPRNLNNKPKNNRNEPAYLPHIANEIALLINLDKDRLIDITYKNSINFFS